MDDNKSFSVSNLNSVSVVSFVTDCGTTKAPTMYISYVDDYCPYCLRMMKQTDTECPSCGAPRRKDNR